MDYDEELIRFLNTMVKFLDSHRPSGFIYNSIFEFVLKNGNLHKPYSKASIKIGKKKECFRNAFLLAEDKDGYLRYVEGYAYSIGLPMFHAWTIDPEGNVYDPTWSDGKAYYGVIFPLNYVRKVIVKRKFWGVIDCWDIGYPLLTGEDQYPIQ